MTSATHFIAAPAGWHNATCIRAEEIPPRHTGERARVQLVWELDAAMDDGRPYVIARRYTAWLLPCSMLRRDLEAWRGRPFTLKELKKFRLIDLLEKPARLLVEHVPQTDPPQARVAALTPTTK